jgi:DNA-binding transcriptional MerR regulator
MTIKLADYRDPPARPAGDAAASATLRGARVARVGRLAALDPEEFDRACERHGAAAAADLGGATVAVVGAGPWPRARWGRPAAAGEDRLAVLEELDRRATAGELVVLTEPEFLARIGLDPSGAAAAPDGDGGGPQRFTTAGLTELLGVSRERVRAWVRAGLLRPADDARGVWGFDFRQVAAARTLCDLTAAGVTTERIRRSLALLRKFLPHVEQPLEQLAALEKSGGGELLVRLAEGDLAEPSGQLHFEFGGGEDAADHAAGAATGGGMRIAPGPRSAAEWVAQGVEQERDGYLEEAAASYREALLAGGPDAQTSLNLANVLRALGSKHQALERYAQAVEADPAFAAGWNNLGTLLAELGKPEEACDAFRRALTADPDDARARYNLADTLDDLGRPDEAKPHWRAYLRHDADSRWADHARRRLG